MGWKGKKTIELSSARIAKLDKERRTIDRKEGDVVPEPEDLALGETRKFELAILHIDIDDFKRAIGNLSMTEMMRFASIFLTEMTYIVKDFDGSVEQYVGDSVTALFGVGYEPPKNVFTVGGQVPQ
jgi:class 3 adenylate cyclase